MTNIHLQRDGVKLVITVDLSAEGVESASGKTLVLASTRGNQGVPGTKGVMVGVNVYAYPNFEID